MFVKADVFFKNAMKDKAILTLEAKTNIPEELAKRFKKNVAPITPMKTGALRRSIITLKGENEVLVGWRAGKKALAQNAGGHTVKKPIRGINPETGKYSTIRPGYYRYKKYTTPGTIPRFAQVALELTQKEVDSVIRGLRLY